MLMVRKAGERGLTRTDMCECRHSFSFDQYRDPGHLGFGALRAINDHTVAGGGGLGPDRLHDMEIVTYVLLGAAEHRDSTGTCSLIRAGDIQRISAGTGIEHSETNASENEPVRLLQFWVTPSQPDLPPGYERKPVDAEALRNHFARLAAPDPRECEVRLSQDAEIWAAKLDEDAEIVQPIEEGRRIWLQIAAGSVEINEIPLGPGDGISAVDEEQVVIRAREPAHMVLFDLA